MQIRKFKTFLNEMKKHPGDDYSLRDINPGDEVSYQGSKYYVIDSNEVVLVLNKEPNASTDDRKNFLVNRNMFKQFGAIKD